MSYLLLYHAIYYNIMRFINCWCEWDLFKIFD